MLRDVVNNQLLPKMARHGFPVEGLRFDWDDSVDYTPEQQVAYETMIADRYDVEPKYFAEKYSMPVGDRRNPTAPIDPNTPTDPKKAKNSAPQPSSSRGYNPAPSAASFFD